MTCEKERKEYELASKELENAEEQIAGVPVLPLEPGKSPSQIPSGLFEKAKKARERMLAAKKALSECEGRKQ